MRGRWLLLNKLHWDTAT